MYKNKVLRCLIQTLALELRHSINNYHSINNCHSVEALVFIGAFPGCYNLIFQTAIMCWSQFFVY